MKKKLNAAMTGIVGVIGGIGTGVFISRKFLSNLQSTTNKEDKFRAYYNLLNNWLIIKQSGKSIEVYFKENNIKTIAIYGMGELGNRLYDELLKTDIKVLYAIDNSPGYTYSNIDVYSLENELEEVDAIVVTAIFDYDEIEKKLLDNGKTGIISLQKIIEEV